ncbi:MAG: neutral zinc metallopeptidase, partial [Xanthomonadales bacterium]|nr:neutral zinc metallopeptidase [Xanthomonadales bacterium]
MKWKGRRTSSNVEDARGRRVTAGGAGATALLSLVGRSFGWKGILVVVVLGLVGWKMGLIDPSMLTGGAPQVQEVEYQPTPEEQELFQFVQVVLADTEDIWSREFQRIGEQYQEPQLVIYKDRY